MGDPLTDFLKKDREERRAMAKLNGWAMAIAKAVGTGIVLHRMIASGTPVDVWLPWVLLTLAVGGVVWWILRDARQHVGF